MLINECRAAYDKYLQEQGQTEDPFDWFTWQYAWDSSYSVRESQKPVGMPLEHGMNRTGNAPRCESDCTCGLKWRIQLQTEREMHNTWRKRAEEAEASLLEWESQKPVDCVERVAIEIAHAISMLPEWSKKGDLDQFPGCRDLFLKAARAAIAATPARESGASITEGTVGSGDSLVERGVGSNPSPSLGDWQPIETAPMTHETSGTRIIATDGLCVHIMYFGYPSMASGEKMVAKWCYDDGRAEDRPQFQPRAWKHMPSPKINEIEGGAS